MAGFVGGDAETLGEVGRRLAALGSELGVVAEAAGSQARRAAGASGHDVLSAALDGWAATWGGSLTVLAAHVVAVAALASVGGGDLSRLDGVSDGASDGCPVGATAR